MNKRIMFRFTLAIFSLLLISSRLVQAIASESALPPEATAAESEASFRNIAYLEHAFLDATPVKRDDGLPVDALGVDASNKALLLKFAEEIAEGQHGNFDSLLISQNSKLLFESYYLRGRVNLPHPQASATKVYTSLAIGRAIQLGYLSMEDLDKPVVGFLKKLDSSTFVKGVERLTLHQAMTMRSGIRLTQEQRDRLGQDHSALIGQGQIQQHLENSASITQASQSFLYQDDPIFAMQVLEAVVPGTAEQFIEKELLQKLGITEYKWSMDVSGLPQAGSRASMTSRAMIKWGDLVRKKGKWNGEQLIPEAYIARSTVKIVDLADEDIFDRGKNLLNQGYGYYWWTADMLSGNKAYPTISARGGWGQFILIIEELDLVVVITAHDNDTPFLQLVAERVLPAFLK